MRINTKSILFRVALLYIIVTVLNISIFIVLVFENQLDLIAENAILETQHTGSNLKYRIENIVSGGEELEEDTTGKIFKEAVRLGIPSLALYSDTGSFLAAFEGGRRVQRPDAGEELIKLINIALTKREFEEKLFFHQLDRQSQLIHLYIPFIHNFDNTAVAVIELELKDVRRQMAFLYRQALILGALIIGVHSLFAFIVSKMVVQPLRTLTRATQEISLGMLDTRVPIVRDDEIGQLANAFNEMSVALKGIRDEAKEANPLTGLPGNTQIILRLERRLLETGEFCLMYIDIDNFKAYNDKYGFTRGDEAILYTRDCILQVAARQEFERMFIGHQGGDDFVVICDYEYWEDYARQLIQTYDGGISRFYNNTDNQNGYIESKNRLGQRQRFPLMSISVAVATNNHRRFSHPAEMVEVVAEVKSYLKTKEGSIYKIDNRQPKKPVQPIIEKESRNTENEESVNKR
jgi:GGDEF domain-containing protein